MNGLILDINNNLVPEIIIYIILDMDNKEIDNFSKLAVLGLTVNINTNDDENLIG